MSFYWLVPKHSLNQLKVSFIAKAKPFTSAHRVDKTAAPCDTIIGH